MDTTIISVLVTGFGTVLLTVTAMAALVVRSIGNLRSHMDRRIDALTHANQQAHDAIGLRIDAQGAELRGRIDDLRSDIGKRMDAQGAELRGRIESLEVRLARTSEDVSFIKGRLTGQPDDGPISQSPAAATRSTAR